jgi:hypothetical protein
MAESDSLDLEESKDDAMYLSSGYELLSGDTTTGKMISPFSELSTW